MTAPTVLDRLPPSPDGLFDLIDLAEALNLCRTTVYRAFRRGVFPGHLRHGPGPNGGKILIPIHVIEAAFQAGRLPRPLRKST
jgi:hypothetical protein